MLIAGEKWACEACVRGHRVSNCQHSDRPLQHINKKGRPVSQCPHCRSLRKSRSAHARCDCGEKAHTKANCGQDGESQDVSCCCSHGARCTCAYKKEHTLDPVPESDTDEVAIPNAPRISGRPRAATTQSDGSVSVHHNGIHKTTHKHNTMAHRCGLPYVVPRSYSVHGASSIGLANRATEHASTPVAHAPAKDSNTSTSFVFDMPQDQRLVKSEHASPIIGASLDALQNMSTLPPLDLSMLAGDFNLMPTLEDPAIPEHEVPLFSAGLSNASVDWSHYDGLDFHTDNLGPSYSQPPSWFDFSSIDQPGLASNSTSGEQSEVDDTTFGMGMRAPPSVMSSQDYGMDEFRAEPAMVGVAHSGHGYHSTIGTQDALDDIDRFLRDAAAANQTILSDGTVLENVPASTGADVKADGSDFMMPDATVAESMWMSPGVYMGSHPGHWMQ